MDKLREFRMRHDCELCNALTDYIDEKYLGGSPEIRAQFGTYIYLDECSDAKDDYYIYPIRVPGATRGHLQLSIGHILEKVEIYESSYYGCCPCYYESIKDEKFEDFIGEKLFC